MRLQELHNSLFWVINNQENLLIITEADNPICVDEDKSIEKMLWEFSIFYNYTPQVDFSLDLNTLNFRELMVEVQRILNILPEKHKEVFRQLKAPKVERALLKVR